MYPLAPSRTRKKTTAPAALAFAVVTSVIVTGCGPSRGLCEQSVSVDPHAWMYVDDAHDPFTPADGDVVTRCVDGVDVRVEDFGIDASMTVETGACNWATVETTLPVGIGPGDTLKTRVWVESQYDFEGAVAHVILRVGADDVVTNDVTVPTTTGQLLSDTVTIENRAEAGTPVFFHVGNHGANSWNLLEFTLKPKVVCDEATTNQ